MTILFNKTKIFKDDLSNIKKVLSAGQTGGNWIFTKNTEKLLEKQIKGSKRILLTSSCTHALEMCAILLNIKKGDEIIVPSYTFVTTALSFYMHGAKIIFADINPKTQNIDPHEIEKLITKKTKAIVVMHYGGVSCEMNKIIKLAKKNKLKIVEDNAQGLYGKFKGKFLGTFGDLATVSFHETKNFSSGLGGALIINNRKFIKRAKIIRDKGTNRDDFSKGLVKKYAWVDKGSSYLMPEISAATLYNQIKNSKKIMIKRKKIWNYYYRNLKLWSEKNKIKLPLVPKGCEQTYHIFYLIFSNKLLKEKLATYLHKKKIKAYSHYSPLHNSKMGRLISQKKYNCKNSQETSDRILRLPMFYDLTFKNLKYIIATIKKSS